MSQYPDREALRVRTAGRIRNGRRYPPPLPPPPQPEIAVGEITGPYRWAPDGDADMPHVRAVTWHVTDLPRVAFDPDLRYSFGGSVTVCSVTRNHAEPRVRAMIDDLRELHPGPQGAMVPRT